MSELNDEDKILHKLLDERRSMVNFLCTMEDEPAKNMLESIKSIDELIKVRLRPDLPK